MDKGKTHVLITKILLDLGILQGQWGGIWRPRRKI